MVCGAPTLPEITLDDFNSLIHTVYEAGINPHKWSAFVGDLSGHLDDTLICLHAHDTVARASLGLLASGAAPEFIDSYVRDYATINVWANGMAIAPIGKLVQSEEIYDPDKLLKTEFYNDCLRSQSLVSASAVALHRSSDRMLFLSGNIRLRNHDLVRARVNRTFDLLGPHITRSFELMRHIPHQVEGEDYRATLETSTDAVLFIDRAGRITHCNRAGTAMRKDASFLAVDRDGHLHLKDPRADTTLRIALAAIARADFPAIPGSFPVRRAAGSPMRAMIVPLAHRTTQTMFDQIFEDLPIAMLVLRNQPTPQPSVAALPGYGLTPAESELAVAIAQGISLRDHADSRDVSIHTVRAQLKSVFAKTETRRQSQLAALILRH